MTYWIVSVFCVFNLILGMVSIMQNDLIEEETRNMFLGAGILLTIATALDTVAMCFNTQGAEQIITFKAVKILEFIICPIIPAVGARIIARRSWWRKVGVLFWVIISVNTCLQIVTFLQPLMFQITEDSIYIRTTFGYSYLIVIGLCIVLFVITTKHTYIQISDSTSWLIVAMMGMIGLGVLLREIKENCNSDFLAIAMSYSLMYIYFSNSYLRIDTTTKLLNRRTFDNKMSSTHYTTAIISIDANNFKYINDEYGHARGDWALSKIAEAILDVFKNDGLCYRPGGDEFVVILHPNVIRRKSLRTENSDRYLIVEDMIDELDDKLEKMAQKDSMLRYGVSAGYGIHYSKKDTSEIDKYKTMQEVYEIADQNMYKVKQEKKRKWEAQEKKRKREKN